MPGICDYRFDSIDERLDVTNDTDVLMDAPLLDVRSTGLYNEGIRFNCFHTGCESYCLFITLDGRGKMEYRGVTCELKRGDVVFTNNMETVRTYGSSEEWRFCFFNVSGAACRYYEELWNGGRLRVISVERPEMFDDYRRRINTMLNRSGLARRLDINLLVNEMLSAPLSELERAGESRKELQHPAWIAEAADYLAANPTDTLKISEVADRFFINPTHFARLFKKYTGKTPKEYQIICRMDEAAMLLRSTSLSIVEIANRTGFASQSFFTKVFRRIYNQTPTEYRRSGTKLP